MRSVSLHLLNRMARASLDELLELCVKNLALLHSNISDEESTREQVLEYYAYDWNADPNMSGSVAMFAPGQFRRLYPSLIQPCANGNLHFVGEGKSGKLLCHGT
jgi:monoamine oxidase